MKHSIYLTFFLFTLSTQSIFAQQKPSIISTEPMSLEECLYFAVENNPNLKSVALQENVTAAQIKEIRTQGMPQINGTGQYSYNFALAEQLLPGELIGQPVGTTIPVTFGVANNITGNVELQQLIFSKSYFTGLKAAKTSEELTKLNTFKTTEDLVYNVAKIYMQLQITEKQKGILNANMNRIDQLIEIADIQLEEGIIKKINVTQLKVNRINLLSEQQSLEIGKIQQLNLLKMYMGFPFDNELTIQIEDEKEVEEQKSEYMLVEKLSINQNSNLKLLNKQMEIKKLELENVNAGYFPSLSGFVRYGWQGQTDKLFSGDEQYKIYGSNIGIIGLSLNVPIFDSFRKKHQAEQVIVAQNQLNFDRQNLINSIQMEFNNATQTLKQNRTLINTQKENMNLAEELYEVTRLSYQEGVAPLTELLDAETSLKESQTQYLTSLLQLNLAELDFMKSSGQLAELIQNAEKSK
ncbi:outer membrane protein [Bernardetia litoralis DSM 6794]|uniref:Outer membrane protein n=1 Tax=Bernardetia litoralis (strain ATCC 23117 / DSM 6794 / NBRC 15988 / NCIMB 1366 / Fx l1 / Sio-4) TaxID=880071 RepID=I4AGE2_BERLS|nr:TolC family protein [Bernardetia litoralis]AFM03027.1 outer membrane protein [Bernardetia litoralis DSM 6794]